MFARFVTFTLLLCCFPALACAEIGSIKRTVGQAFVERENKLLTAQSGMYLERRDILVTGPNGRLSVTFIDNSRFSLRPNTILSLAAFQFNETTHEGSFVVDPVGGGVAITSGQIVGNRPDAMRVRFPTMVLGIRGTRFVVKAGVETYLTPETVPPTLVLFPDEPDVLNETDPQPKSSAIAVLDDRGDERLVIDTPYSVFAGATADGSLSVAPADIERSYALTLGFLPPPPSNYILYFGYDSTQLTAESEANIIRILADFGSRAGADLLVVGHTDRSGTDAYNDRLSLERALQIRNLLISLGVDPARVRAAGRGEREPLVSTPDGIKEGRNRRIQVIVR